MGEPEDLMTKSLSVRIKARTAIIADTIKLVELDAAGLNLESTNGEIESVDSNHSRVEPHSYWR